MSKQSNQSSASSDTRSRILDAVTDLIHSGGLAAVTLSAVCKRAGISKGGLVHHYPSKEAMVGAFLHRAGASYLEQVEAAMGNRKAGSGRRAAAYIDLFLGDPSSMGENAEKDCSAVMVALVQGGGQSEMNAIYQRIQEMLCEDGLSLELADLVIASVDGIWLQSMIGPAETLAARSSRLHRRLKRMIREEFTSKKASKRPSTSL
ncbi:MAG: TetR/AcrR family transcriptional regulator [Aureliella sp.]